MPAYFTLRQLEYFAAVAKAGSIAAGATEVRVAQPSISNAIAKLESRLGVQLFIRHHAQGVSLTPAGSRILDDARSLLRQAHDLQNFAEDAGAAVKGPLEIGCFSTIAPALLPELIAGFTTEHAGVHVGIHEGTQHDLVAGLESGRFDMALLYDLELPDGLVTQRLASFRPYVLLPPDHDLAAGENVSLNDLIDEPLILLDVPPSRNYFVGLFSGMGKEPNIVFSSSSLEMVRGLVGQGRGYSLLVTRPFGDRTYDGRALAIRPIAGNTRKSHVCLTRLASIRPTRLMQTFSDYCQTWFKGRDNRLQMKC